MEYYVFPTPVGVGGSQMDYVFFLFSLTPVGVGAVVVVGEPEAARRGRLKVLGRVFLLHLRNGWEQSPNLVPQLGAL